MKIRMNIDLCKFIASFMIVAIHVFPFFSFHVMIDYVITRILFRVAVPFFFMVTGYFVLSKAVEDITVIQEYTKKIFRLCIISTVIYIPILIYNGYFHNTCVSSILKDIFFDGMFYHLWYFPALLLGIWITYFFLRKFRIQIVGIILLFLYIIGLFGDSYFGILKGNSFFLSFYQTLFQVFDYTRNGFFYAPIFLYMGYLLNEKKFNIHNMQIFFFLIISIVLLIIEGILLYVYKIPRHTSMYIFLLPVSFFLFYIIVKNSVGVDKNLRRMSTWIYIIHPFVIAIYHFFVSRISSSFFDYHFVQYLIVVFLTVGFIFVLQKMIGVVKKLR